jgi:glutamate dehydrogenase/leucine dehydrogenase
MLQAEGRELGGRHGRRLRRGQRRYPRGREGTATRRGVVACSDSTGVVHDENGLDIQLLKQVKTHERGSLETYAARRGGAVRVVRKSSVWQIPRHGGTPCATQNELTGADAERLIANGVISG